MAVRITATNQVGDGVSVISWALVVMAMLGRSPCCKWNCSQSHDEIEMLLVFVSTNAVVQLELEARHRIRQFPTKARLCFDLKTMMALMGWQTPTKAISWWFAKAKSTTRIAGQTPTKALQQAEARLVVLVAWIRRSCLPPTKLYHPHRRARSLPCHHCTCS